MMSLLAVALLSVSPSLAGSGPWTLGPGDLTVYAGSEYSRATRYIDGKTGEEPVLTGNGVQTQGLKAIVTVGVADGLEVEASLPYTSSSVLAENGIRCDTLGLEPCEPTRGFGALTLRAKAMVLDQFDGPPVSLAFGAELREGAWTANTRHRLTGLGEGTTDVGGFLAVGRSGGLGSGTWLASLESGGRYRMTTSTWDGQGVPGPEVFGGFEALAGPGRILLGPAAYGLHRWVGRDLSTTSYSQFDRFSAVRVTSVTAGGKVLFFGERGAAVAVGVQRAIQSVNNPSDLLLISVGVSMYRPRPEDA